MKKSILSILTTGFAFLLFCLAAACSSDDNKADAKPYIDLTAESLEFSVEKIEDFFGNVTIIGTIKNIGEDYQSSEGKQTVRLVERSATGQVTTLVEQKFVNLAAGETIVLEYVVQGWRSSEEFPPGFQLGIYYEPDIYIDGNPNNDDANPKNDFLEKKGTEINKLF